jgi:integrating conjugative element protein (TIGR03765 family)
MNASSRCVFLLLLSMTKASTALADDGALIVVEDHGGVSALPYYGELSLQPRSTRWSSPNPSRRSSPLIGRARYSEADMLPVRSTRLTPGPVEHRAIDVPGLTPLFLIGDDDRSRAWLREHLPRLRTLRAVGFVVRVDSAQALTSLRELASGLTLVPASGDDLGNRLGLRHYPVLITATGIEQ